MKGNNRTYQDILHATALLALTIGTIGSLYFMFNAGSNQKSIILLGLFTAWVTSPFVGIFFAIRLIKRWTGKIPTWFYLIVFLLTVVSLAAYSGVLTLSQTKAAFNFLVVPFLSWFVILTILFIYKRHNL